MPPADTVLLVAAIILFASLVRSSLGFGDAVVAMPLLAILLPLKTATPLVAFMGPTIAVLILARNWRKGDLKTALSLVLASFAGIPVGVYGLTRLPEPPLKIVLGTIILLYGLLGLLRPSLRITKEKSGVPWAVGFGAGILGGAYNTSGPPVVAYGVLRGWTPERFRTTLQGFFLPTGLMVLVGHGVAGLWTGDVLKLLLVSLPGLFLGFLIGERINRKLPPGRFNRLVYVFFLLMGGFLVLRTLLA